MHDHNENSRSRQTCAGMRRYYYNNIMCRLYVSRETKMCMIIALYEHMALHHSSRYSAVIVLKSLKQKNVVYKKNNYRKATTQTFIIEKKWYT